MTELTPEKILEIARRNGEFSLTWHYRVDKWRRVAKALQKKGLLKLVRSNRGADVWKPTNEPNQSTEGE